MDSDCTTDGSGRTPTTVSTLGGGGASPAESSALFSHVDEMMEDMIDCLYEYEEKIESVTGKRCEKSAAEQFEDAKRNAMKHITEEALASPASAGIIDLLQKKLAVAQEETKRLSTAAASSTTRSEGGDGAESENVMLRKDNEELHRLLEEAEKALAETEEMENELVKLRKENRRARKALKKLSTASSTAKNADASTTEDSKTSDEIIDTLRSKLRSAESERDAKEVDAKETRERLESELEALRAKVQEFEVESDAKNVGTKKMRENLESEIDALRSKLRSSEAEAERLARESLKLAEATESLREENEGLKKGAIEHRGNAETLANESMALAKTTESLREENAALRTEVQKHKTNADALAGESLKLAEAAEKLKSEKDTLEERARVRKAERERLEKESLKLADEMRTIKTENAKLRESGRKAREARAAASEKHRSHADDLAKESLKLAETTERLKAEKADLSAIAEKRAVELERVVKERDELAREAEKLTSEGARLRAERESDREETERLRGLVEKHRESSESMAKESLAVASEAEKLKSEIDRLRARAERAESARASAETSGQNLKTEIETTKSRLASESARAQTLATDLDAERARATKLETDLGETSAKLASARGAHAEHAKLLREAESEIRDLQETNERLARESATTSKRASTLKRALEEVRHKCATVRADTRALRTSTAAQLKQLPKMVSPTDPQWASLASLARKQMDRVRAAEDMYAREFKERRRLHDLVQELRGNIRVFCRVRPPLPKESDTRVVCRFPMEGVVAVENERKRREKQWEFDRVFNTGHSTEDLFREVEPLVTSVMDGFNVCVFAYGQTGSGKTYTMEGTKTDRGIYWRSLAKLFAMRRERMSTGWKVEIQVSLLEVYNEIIRDLLSDDTASSKRGLSIKLRRETGENYVDGLTKCSVETLAEIQKYMRIGKKVRATGCTDMNERSSRSHCMLSVYVSCTAPPSSGGKVFAAKLHLVDLAGSERLSKSKATGARQKETKMINKSLSALGDVIAAQANKHGHVPYRNSTLTYLLQDSLGGNSKTLMIAQVAPTAFNADESYCTLEFSSRTRCVELGRATKNVVDSAKDVVAPPMQRSKSTSPRARSRRGGRGGRSRMLG